MADENKDENEEQDDFFGDDDDFGLPDLEYEALDGDGEKADEPLEEEIVSETPEETTPEEKVEEPEPEPTPDPVPEVEEDTGLGLGLDSDFESGTDEAGSSDTATGEGSSDDLGDDMYSDEDFGDFNVDDIDLDEEIPDSVFDSDILDDDEFKEFETGNESSTEELETAEPSFSSDDTQSSKGKFTRIVIFGTILFVGLGFTFWYAYNNWLGGDEKQVAKKEVPKKAPTKKPAAQEKPATNTEAASTEQPKTTPVQNKPSATQASKSPVITPIPVNSGTVNKLEARTGNVFVIIGSFVDGDIAMDYANKLAAEGKSPSIIPPFGNGLFHRVAIAGFPTIATATQNLDNYKGDYGQDVWILKY